MFTIYNEFPCVLLDKLEKMFELEQVVYYKFQVEQCPKTGNMHLQGYVHFKNNLGMKTVKKKLGEGHYEVRKGTAEEAAAYAGKDETRVDGPWENGDITKCKQGARSDIKEFLAFYVKHPKREITKHPEHWSSFVRYHSGAEKLRSLLS